MRPQEPITEFQDIIKQSVHGALQERYQFDFKEVDLFVH